ncbi:protein BRANCHLESS TRICHOME [Cinnamomum micranthum f. kanehirae]|uniref:Protein BRANCHLESS TRICHOME n=1 Tax=Cinnamomum micranthum f. kanehirae TaxID=337451 RepID=A0A3S3PEG6_9MAGN|nr:protein BRANCHLESS TRICHOME [Cinnamomum micranthum f. kanehirae]
MNSLLSMKSQLDLALTQIQELKAEIEFERRMRKKAESSKKRLEKELQEERERREATEHICEELAKEIAADRVAMDRMKEEMEEERKMWRVAEVWREERVRMKMAEAKIVMEEKVVQLSKGRETERRRGEDTLGISDFIMGTCGNSNCSNQVQVRSKSQRNGSPEAENPHIRRGIKGFVEFPRVVRAVGSRGRHLGSKLECQKAQLRLLLRQKNPIGLGFGRPSNSNLAVGG